LDPQDFGFLDPDPQKYADLRIRIPIKIKWILSTAVNLTRVRKRIKILPLTTRIYNPIYYSVFQLISRNVCPEIGDFSSMFGITAQSMLDLKIPRKLKTVSSNSSNYDFYYACWVSAII